MPRHKIRGSNHRTQSRSPFMEPMDTVHAPHETSPALAEGFSRSPSPDDGPIVYRELSPCVHTPRDLSPAPEYYMTGGFGPPGSFSPIAVAGAAPSSAPIASTVPASTAIPTIELAHQPALAAAAPQGEISLVDVSMLDIDDYEAATQADAAGPRRLGFVFEVVRRNLPPIYAIPTLSVLPAISAFRLPRPRTFGRFRPFQPLTSVIKKVSSYFSRDSTYKQPVQYETPIRIAAVPVSRPGSNKRVFLDLDNTTETIATWLPQHVPGAWPESPASRDLDTSCIDYSLLDCYDDDSDPELSELTDDGKQGKLAKPKIQMEIDMWELYGVAINRAGSKRDLDGRQKTLNKILNADIVNNYKFDPKEFYSEKREQERLVRLRKEVKRIEEKRKEEKRKEQERQEKERKDLMQSELDRNRFLERIQHPLGQLGSGCNDMAGVQPVNKSAVSKALGADTTALGISDNRKNHRDEDSIISGPNVTNCDESAGTDTAAGHITGKNDVLEEARYPDNHMAITEQPADLCAKEPSKPLTDLNVDEFETFVSDTLDNSPSSSTNPNDQSRKKIDGGDGSAGVRDVIEGMRHFNVDGLEVEMSAKKRKEKEEQVRFELLKREEEDRRKAEAEARRIAEEEARRIADEEAAEKLRLSEEEIRLAKEASRPIIIPISQEATDAIDHAARQGHNAVHALFLKGYDYGTVLPRKFGGQINAWLNDNIVNEFLKQLVETEQKKQGWKKGGARGPPVQALSSQWFEKVEKDKNGKEFEAVKGWHKRANLSSRKILDAKLIFIPICHESHWRLMVIKPQDRTIEFLDSLQPTHRQQTHYVDVALRFLKFELGNLYVASEWTHVANRSARQDNSRDCGVFAAFNAVALVRNQNPGELVTANLMPQARMQLAATLLQGGFSGEFQL